MLFFFGDDAGAGFVEHCLVLAEVVDAHAKLCGYWIGVVVRAIVTVET
jgi:hypothetical protein